MGRGIKKLFLLSFVASFLLLFVYTPLVFACSPAGPDSWYKTSLQFDEMNFPQGISIVQTDPKYEPHALINTSQTPFYIVKENWVDWKEFPGSELPQNYEPLYKLVSNQVFFWGQKYSSKDTIGWKANDGGINNSASKQLKIGENIYVLEEESRQVYQDNRPANVEMPQSQNFSILSFYQGRPFEISGTLSYSLNNDYDPRRFVKGVEACAKWNRTMSNPLWKIFSYLPTVILLLIIGGVSFIVYKVVRRFVKK